MNSFNFNSAVCTSREQSEKLLSLGLKKETADMAYKTTGKVVDMGEVRWMYQHTPSVVYKGLICEEDIPAWSLHRLWELANLRHIILDSKDEIPKLYDEVIAFIEFEIKESQFNKDYLV